jgi:hypothetical protein
MDSLAKTNAVLDGIEKVNGILTLAITVEGVLVPVVSGIVKGIKQLKNEATGTVTYEFVLTEAGAELQDVQKQATNDLAEINKRLIALGKPPIALPASNVQAEPTSTTDAKAKP